MSAPLPTHLTATDDEMTNPVSALAIATLATLGALAPAHAGEAWASTATKVVAPEFAAAIGKDAMKAGETVHVALALHMHDKAGLDAFVDGIASGRTTSRLTSAGFLAHYAPTPAEAEAVASYLRRSGFTGVQVAKNRMLVTATGTVAAAEAAFNTRLGRFEVDGREAYANLTEAQVPAHLGGIVHAVLGLQTISVGHSMKARAAHDTAATGKTKGVAVSHYASDFSTLYDADGLPPATNSTIAIFTLGDVSQTLADLKLYTAMMGYPDVDVRTIQTSEPSSDASGVDEWNMDTQASLGAAGGQVKQMLLYVGTDFSDASIEAEFNAFVADDLAQTFSNSWGGCELVDQATGMEAATDAILEVAIAQGQTVAVSTGDSGSYTCGSAKGAQAYPAVSPWVMAIGGTTVYSRNGKPASYEMETAWSCAGASDCFDWGGTGGGVSRTEPTPSWQRPVTARHGNAKMRAIPDVAFDGDPTSGLLMMYYGSVDTQYPIAGTSLSAPIFAGLWTRIQSAHANTLGFPGMSLYGLHDTDGGVFHDVRSGENGGYATTPGWDPVTGFGSLDTAKFNAFIDANLGAFSRP